MNQTKEQLLGSPQKGSRRHEYIMGLGRTLTSAQSVEAAAEKAQMRLAANKKSMARWAGLLAYSLAAVIVQALMLLSGHLFGFYESAFWIQLRGWGAVLAVSPLFWLVPFFVAYNFASARDEEENELLFEADMLKPIRGSDACQEALQYVEAGHKEVLAWRDLAIAERGQLYHFDVSVLGHLHGEAEANCRHAAARARVDEACKAVHGIGPVGEHAAA